MLVIVWVAIRFTPLITAAFCLVIGAAAVWLTIDEIGHHAAIDDPLYRAAVAQVFVVVLMVLGLVISLSRQQVLESVVELARSEAANARRAAGLDQVMANLDDGVAIIEHGGRILHANKALRTAFGTQEADPDLQQVRDDSEIPNEERLIRGIDGRLLNDEISPLTRALAGRSSPLRSGAPPTRRARSRGSPSPACPCLPRRTAPPGRCSSCVTSPPRRPTRTCSSPGRRAQPGHRQAERRAGHRRGGRHLHPGQRRPADDLLGPPRCHRVLRRHRDAAGVPPVPHRRPAAGGRRVPVPARP